MNQRIRSCTNSTNFDTINCDAYLSRLLTRDRVAPKSKRERSLASCKMSAGELLASGARTKPSQQQMTKNKPLVKESVYNKPLVEVTVRAHGGVQNNPSREPWDKLLKNKSSTTPFDQFDPLRTIHFLSKELQSKLKSISSSDSQILGMLATMQQALDRIPPDVSATTIPLKKSKSEIRTHNKPSFNDIEEVPEKLVTGGKIHKSCQTVNILSYTDSEIFQRKLESSTAKLESSCKQMEILCEQLKNEKRYVEELLQTETNKVVNLKQQLEALQNEKNEYSNTAFDKVVQERQELENQLKQLKAQVSSYHGPAMQELKSRLQELQTQKMTLEQENIALRHKLASSDMEREKYVTLLNMRDRHINEILNEMNCLQEVVSEQLVDLQKGPTISSPSSQSTMIGMHDNYSSLPWTEVELINSHEPKDNVEPSRDHVFNLPLRQLHFKTMHELESGDNSFTNILTKNLNMNQKKTKSAPFLSKDNILKGSECGENEIKNLTNIHELFNELKLQAMTLNLPQFSAGIKTTENPLNSPSDPSSY